MSPDFDFWDNEEPIYCDNRNKRDNEVKTKVVDEPINFNNSSFINWSTKGTFAARYEENELIITVCTVEGIDVTIKVPFVLVHSFMSTEKTILNDNRISEIRRE